jgi:hypothetical protein
MFRKVKGRRMPHKPLRHTTKDTKHTKEEKKRNYG